MRVGLWPASVVFAVGTLAVARSHPAGSFAGLTTAGGAIEIGAAISLAGAGLLFWGSRPRNPVGPLLVAASAAWLLPEWSNPEVGFAPMFTLGLVGLVACGPLVVHVALAYPRGWVGQRAERVLVATAYVGGLGMLGLVPALVFDPRRGGCSECPANLVLVHADNSLYEQLSRWGIRFGIVWTSVAVLALVVRTARSSLPALRVNGPVALAAVAYLGLLQADLWHSVDRGFLSTDEADVRFWKLQGGALVVMGLALGWALVRARQTRTSVAEYVVELGRAPRLGGARDTLAAALRDPTLRLIYRRAHGREYVDLDGEAVAGGPNEGHAATPLIRDGREIAVIFHAERLLSDPGTIEGAIAAARLAVENEQLQAEVQAQMKEIRASRARIVATADAARKRLERDLHDGAQQRLVGLSLALRLLRNEAERSGADDAITAIDAAGKHLHEALAELREVAHGIYPAVLADEGLAAAFETLAERSPGRLRLERLPEDRFPATVEAAAYFAAAEMVRDLDDGQGSATIAVTRANGRLKVEVERSAEMEDGDERLLEIADRVGAIDGRVEVTAGSNGNLRMQAEIPCA